MATAATAGAESGNALVGQGHKDGGWKEVDIYAADDPQWSSYFDIVRKRIKGKFRYPPEEIDRRKSGGTLMVRFGIKKNGELSFTEVMRTSGNEALDRNAVEAIRQAAPFPRLPQENVQGINVPMDMHYILHK
ncbi:MAG: cell envelope integrity protein TolA [Deltaproteobacteria bacterium]|nr:cell envelope integrity protein TolA [Deltaproteobacteria bacterium]